MTTETEKLQAKSLDVPEQTRSIGGVLRIDSVSLGDITAMRAAVQPGFHWAEHIKPAVGTELCEARHVGYVLSGGFRVRMADGIERDIEAGEAYNVPPGHDMWVLGNEPYTCVEWDFGGGR